MKKVIMISGILFRVDSSFIQVYRIVGIAATAGVEALPKKPGECYEGHSSHEFSEKNRCELVVYLTKKRLPVMKFISYGARNGKCRK
jgi:hypothetical protein